MLENLPLTGAKAKASNTTNAVLDNLAILRQIFTQFSHTVNNGAFFSAFIFFPHSFTTQKE